MEHLTSIEAKAFCETYPVYIQSEIWTIPEGTCICEARSEDVFKIEYSLGTRSGAKVDQSVAHFTGSLDSTPDSEFPGYLVSVNHGRSKFIVNTSHHAT